MERHGVKPSHIWEALNAAAFRHVARASRISSIFLREDDRLNVYAGELEVRPPGVPTRPNPLTGKEFVAIAAKEFGVAPKYRVLRRPLLRIVGWFDPLVAESYEMLYQSDSPYLLDSSKFAREFGFVGTSYAEGIRTTAASFKRTGAP